MRCNNLLLLLAGLVVVLPFYACSPATPTAGDSKASARIIVTRDFGQELILDQMVDILEGQNALEALQGLAEVGTLYGGGFVSSINGIASQFGGIKSSREDWFFFVNGIMSNSGARDYSLFNGDVERWDFHDWSFRKFTPAIIAFPEPFLHGYGGEIRPTIIVCAPEFEVTAEKLKNSLLKLGVKEVETKPPEDLKQAEKELSNIILLGKSEDRLISEINQEWQRQGFWAYFRNESLTLLDSRGQTSNSPGEANGLIQATQNPWNPNGNGAAENVVWLITGTNNAGVESAAGILLNSPEQIANAFAVATKGEQVIRLPR